MKWNLLDFLTSWIHEGREKYVYYESIKWELKTKLIVYYESTKWEVNTRLMFECRWDARLKVKVEGSTRLENWFVYYESINIGWLH